MARENLSRWKRFRRWIRLQAVNVVRENSTPAQTGLGFALGIFIGVFPSFAVGTPLAFFFAGRLGWNRAAAMGGTFLMNPFTAPVLYSASTWLGLKILGRELEAAPVSGLLNYLQHYGLAFLLGNTLFAIALATFFGLIAFGFAARHQRGQGVGLPADQIDPERGAAFDPAALRLDPERAAASTLSGVPVPKPVLQTDPLPPQAA
jgi:uncharacterized protein (DUF2062 family)